MEPTPSLATPLKDTRPRVATENQKRHKRNGKSKRRGRPGGLTEREWLWDRYFNGPTYEDRQAALKRLTELATRKADS